MIKQDPITRIHPIRLSIIHHNPIGVQFRTAIRRAGVERRRFALRRLDDFAVQLGRRGLVEPHVLLQPACSDSVEEAESAKPINVPRVFCHLKRDFNVRLRAKIVDLRRLDLCNDVHEVGAIAEITIMKLELDRTYRVRCERAFILRSLGEKRGKGGYVRSCWSSYR